MARAELLRQLRDFFEQRGVVEVETPLLLPAAATAPGLTNFESAEQYLQTSPEVAMKRLLSRGSGDIYQICKAFRREERGRLHHPEFTILEWYRVGWDHHRLMDEVSQLLTLTTAAPPAVRYTYREVWEDHLGFNPHTADLHQLQNAAKQANLWIANLGDDCDSWMQLLFTQLIEPRLPPATPVLIYHFPKSQAMLARIHQEGADQVAERFELYYQGMELANGFHELRDPDEQRGRFESELAQRYRQGLPIVPIDEAFLADLTQLPDCAGVAVGLDRWLLAKLNATSLDQILVFRDW